jgi:hypothetical protein
MSHFDFERAEPPAGPCAEQRHTHTSNQGFQNANEFVCDVQRSISQTDCLFALREVLNAALEIPAGERAAWLMRHIDDPEDRQAVATLLLAHDGEGLLEVDAG